MSAELAYAHAALRAGLVEQARERAANDDELRRQLADERAWRQACFGTLVRFLTCWGLAGAYMYTYVTRVVSVRSWRRRTPCLPGARVGFVAYWAWIWLHSLLIQSI